MEEKNREQRGGEGDLLQIADAAVKGMTAAGTARAGRLRRRVRRAMRAVRTLSASLGKKGVSDDGHSGVAEWLEDNFCLLDAEAGACLRELKKAGALPEADGVPRLYTAFTRFLAGVDRPLDGSACDAILAAAEKRLSLTLAEHFAAPALFRAALLEAAADVCRAFRAEGLFDRTGRLAARLECVVRSLRYLAYHRFDKSLSLSRVDAILRRDPAGAYGSMTSETRAAYLASVAANAKRAGVPETVYAKRLLSQAQCAPEGSNRRHIGHELYRPKKSLQKAYFVCLFGAVLFLYALLCALSPYCLPLLFPLWETVKLLVDRLFSRFVKTRPLPRMQLDRVPDDAPVLVVITSLLLGEKSDAALFDRLERLYLSNGGDNIVFGVLGDLADAASACRAGDGAVLDYAYGRVDALCRKYGAHFLLLERRRSYSKSEELFLGWERKRGAVCELVRYLHDEETTFTPRALALADAVLKKDGACRVRYVVTLDADTNLPLDAVREMCAVMLHPLHRPQIDKTRGIVTDGYGILQPKCAPELAAASRTPFSRILCGAGGVDLYGCASFDLYQSVFGEGIFCGKGMFDADAFYEVVLRRAPLAQDRILSHDALEGALLRTGMLTDCELTDGFPKNELSYLKRRHRWVRGDVQNLPYLGKTVRVHGEAVPNGISFLSRCKLFDNVRASLVPVFSFLSLCLAAFVPPFPRLLLVLVALSQDVVPLLFDVLSTLFPFAPSGAARRFFSKGVTVGVWQSFLRMLFFVSMLPQTFLSTVDAHLRSLYRMSVSHKRLLEWQTAAQSDAGDGSLLMFVHRNLFCAFAGFFLFAFAPQGILRLVALLWFLFPAVSYLTSRRFFRPGKTHGGLSDRESAAYAADIWRYFAENVTARDNDLPPDNVQLSPRKSVAHRTSPTNIGLYLLSVLCACDFGLISADELCARIGRTVSTLEKLPKWKGHLFNWYDTESCAVLSPRTVSTVDSGNLTACLITLKEGLRDHVHACTALLGLIGRIEALESACDYVPLYDKKRELFSLGALVAPDGGAEIQDGCYDFFMSEARTISYIACARRIVQKKHWAALSRPLLRADRYIGLASWTGTAFEYFMPHLFLPIEKNSLSYEAMRFALKAQSERTAGHGKNKVWGISESAFFAFDSEMNYRYRAFGVPALGLKRGLDKDLVIAPYASFLALCVGKRRAADNLAALKRRGCYGPYGFYEAIDFTPPRGAKNGTVVKSFMAHHLGMSLAALTNARFDGLLCRRFLSDGRMNAARELLEEKIPVGAVIRRIRARQDVPERQQRLPVYGVKVVEDVSGARTNAFVLVDGRARCILSPAGHVELSVGDTLVNVCDKDPCAPLRSLYCLYRSEKTVLSSSLFPLPRDGVRHTFRLSEGRAVFDAACGDLRFSTALSLHPGDVTVFRVSARVSRTKRRAASAALSDGEFHFCFTPCLAEQEAYEAHRSFSALFVEAAYLAEPKLLLFRRRARAKNERERYLAVALADGGSFGFDTREESLFCNRCAAKDLASVAFLPCANETGACIRPYCRVRVFADGSKGDARAELLVSLADTAEKAVAAIADARKKTFEQSAKLLAETERELAQAAGTVPFTTGEKKAPSEVLLSALFFPGGERKTPPSAVFSGIGALWRQGLSGDLPIVALRVPSAALVPRAEPYLRAFRLLRMMRVKLDLALLYAEREPYRCPVRSALFELLEECELADAVGKREGGVFLIDRKADPESAGAVILRAVCALDVLSEETDGENGDEGPLPPETVLRPDLSMDVLPEENAVLQTPGGYFGARSFTVTKDRAIPAPFSFVLCGRRLSTLVTHTSLGYTWAANAQTMRLTPFDDDALAGMRGESLLLCADGRVYDLCAVSRVVTFREGCARYRGNAEGIRFKADVYVSEKYGVKYCDVTLEAQDGKARRVTLALRVLPLLGTRQSESRYVCAGENGGVLEFQNPFSESFRGYRGFLYGAAIGNGTPCRYAVGSKRPSVPFGLAPGEAAAILDGQVGKEPVRARFLLGAYRESGRAREQTLRAAFDGQTEFDAAARFSRSLLPSIEMQPDGKSPLAAAFAPLFDFFLPYQNNAVRFFARSGFYQSGGAWGFRDQLQDALCLMLARPKEAKRHLYRCCAHQFPQGDVLHWWHADGRHGTWGNAGEPFHRGVRTLCSDDFLWLPYVAAEYALFTGDAAFWDVKVRYLDGDRLKVQSGERERYLETFRSDEKGSVYDHCVRALDRGVSRLGAHGLPLIGSGDWCDGFSSVGNERAGESVWLGMFLCLVLERFCAVCRARGDAERAEDYAKARLTLAENIETHGRREKDGQYLRGFYADGKPLGASENDECRIDLLPQCFSVFLPGGDPERAYRALKTAFDELYDKEYGLFRLFAPPFSRSSQEPGYVKGYAAGLRENGGQYTHAAVWGARGLLLASARFFRHGDEEKARELCRMANEVLTALNPAFRASGGLGKAAREAYRGEPYCLAGDVYACGAHRGRAGWTWYTGSAGWYYTVLLRDVFGLSVADLYGAHPTLCVDTHRFLPLPELLLHVRLCLRFSLAEGVCRYTLRVEAGKSAALFLDGERVSDRVLITPGKHTLLLILPEA